MLVVGLGNIFLGDDGFGVEVIKRLVTCDLPDWVRVADFGIRGMDLLYDISDQDYDRVILVDTAVRSGAPGDLYLIEFDINGSTEIGSGTPDALAMTPDMVSRFLRDFGCTSELVLLVGGEPGRLEEEVGLSKPVTQAVKVATTFIVDLIQRVSGASVAVA